jgi:ribonucleotide monophosphatase NagD (HAD superfamily)
MVGDSVKDIAGGLNAGCGITVLVKTGIHADVEAELKRRKIRPDFVAADLSEAAEWLTRLKSGAG